MHIRALEQLMINVNFSAENIFASCFNNSRSAFLSLPAMKVVAAMDDEELAEWAKTGKVAHIFKIGKTHWSREKHAKAKSKNVVSHALQVKNPNERILHYTTPSTDDDGSSTNWTMSLDKARSCGEGNWTTNRYGLGVSP